MGRANSKINIPLDESYIVDHNENTDMLDQLDQRSNNMMQNNNNIDTIEES